MSYSVASIYSALPPDTYNDLREAEHAALDYSAMFAIGTPICIWQDTDMSKDPIAVVLKRKIFYDFAFKVRWNLSDAGHR